ncbi:MAG: PLDc N-terminal domain-containing protein [Candidatus Latescibacterota bacterium]|nr:PLDc N-terminal domain-containing protein [Candidatus Latescibacterota bacterium]
MLGYGLIGLIVFILDIIAIIDVLKSSMDAAMKLVWILVILLLPLIGMILWFLVGKK